jgi:spore coat protein U-like protein
VRAQEVIATLRAAGAKIAAIASLALGAVALTPAIATAGCGVSLSVGTLQYAPFDPSGGSFTGVVQIDCTPKSYPASVQVELSGGVGGDASRRAMEGVRTNTKLAYQIYLPTGLIWGDGSNGTSALSTTVTKAHTRIPFIALVFPGQTAPEDTYADNLVATLDL